MKLGKRFDCVEDRGGVLEVWEERVIRKVRVGRVGELVYKET